jgi:hypothetical protein
VTECASHLAVSLRREAKDYLLRLTYDRDFILTKDIILYDVLDDIAYIGGDLAVYP